MSFANLIISGAGIDSSETLFAHCNRIQLVCMLVPIVTFIAVSSFAVFIW